MLELFVIWAKKKIVELSTKRWTSFLTQSENSVNPSARLDIDTDRALARVTFWSSGHVDLEIISIESDQTVFSHQCNFAGPIDFERAFSNFFSVLERI